MKIYLFVISLSFHLHSMPNNQNDSKVTQSISLLTQNVGGADFKFVFFLRPTPVCPVFKLCHPNIISRIHINITETLPDIIHFQEVASSRQMKDSNAPLIPNNYEFRCTLGAKRTEEICTAWNKERINLISNCIHFNTDDSGFLKCFFRKDNFTFNTINIHPSAWDTEDRKKTIKTLWQSYVPSNENTIIAGDFNTSSETYTNNLPYPPEFGTIFGVSKKNYGRWPSKKDFYGFHKTTKAKDEIVEVSGSTIFYEKIDHAFSNFGSINPEVKTSKICVYSICPGNYFGYQWGAADWSFFSSWGPKIDHLPIWMELAL